MTYPPGPYPAPDPDPQPGYGPPPAGHGPPPGYGPAPLPPYGPAPLPPGYDPAAAGHGYGGPGYGPGYGVGDPAYGGGGFGVDPMGMPVPARTEPLANASMGVGIGSVVALVLACCCPYLSVVSLAGGVAAVVMGFVARRKIQESHGVLGGHGQVLAGMITGGIAAVLGGVGAALSLVFSVGPLLTG